MNLFKRKKSPDLLVASTKKHVEILAQADANANPATDNAATGNAPSAAASAASAAAASSASSSSSSLSLSANGKVDEKSYKKSLEKVSANLSAMKLMLYGDGENDPKEEEINKLITEILTHNLLEILLANMKKFEFEARKDCAQIYSYILRHRKSECVDYLKVHLNLIKLLVEGYNDNEIALNCGAILREVIRHEELAQIILYDERLMDKFYEFVQLNTFDVASDAFSTFKVLLTKHKNLCAKFLESTFDEFCRKYSVLLQAGNYVTKRQSLKLLGELLLNRANFNVMMKYINSADNLKIMMNLLRGTTKAIQFEAFHVFKIFVANPRKSPAVTEILYRNRSKLIDFLNKFQKDKDDEQFNEEKATLIRTLVALQPPPGMEHLANEDHSNDHDDKHDNTHTDANH